MGHGMLDGPLFLKGQFTVNQSLYILVLNFIASAHGDAYSVVILPAQLLTAGMVPMKKRELIRSGRVCHSDMNKRRASC